MHIKKNKQRKTQNDTVNGATHLIPKRTKYCMRKEGEKNHHILQGPTVISQDDVDPEH